VFEVGGLGLERGVREVLVLTASSSFASVVLVAALRTTPVWCKIWLGIGLLGPVAMVMMALARSKMWRQSRRKRTRRRQKGRRRKKVPRRKRVWGFTGRAYWEGRSGRMCWRIMWMDFLHP
jgi:hypothetical protein